MREIVEMLSRADFIPKLHRGKTQFSLEEAWDTSEDISSRRHQKSKKRKPKKTRYQDIFA